MSVNWGSIAPFHIFTESPTISSLSLFSRNLQAVAIWLLKHGKLWQNVTSPTKPRIVYGTPQRSVCSLHGVHLVAHTREHGTLSKSANVTMLLRMCELQDGHKFAHWH
jgi:hypothetical protein